MFLDYYRLREQPFGVTPDTRYLFASAMHREALASLIYSFESSTGFAALIGEPGTGKTLLLFSLLERYHTSAYTALVLNPQCTAHHLLRYVVAEFGIDVNGRDPVAQHEQFKRFLVKAANQRKKVLLIIDEAQHLSVGALETVRLLSNFETTRSKLLHIVLAGQLALGERLQAPGLAQLRQRIPIISRLQPFTADETVEYIQHRLTRAGYNGPALFTGGALQLIVAESGGIPRNVNALCFNALSLGCALQRNPIDTSVLAEVTADRKLAPNAKSSSVAAVACPVLVGQPAEAGQEKSPIGGPQPDSVEAAPRAFPGARADGEPELSPPAMLPETAQASHSGALPQDSVEHRVAPAVLPEQRRPRWAGMVVGSLLLAGLLAFGWVRLHVGPSADAQPAGPASVTPPAVTQEPRHPSRPAPRHAAGTGHQRVVPAKLRDIRAPHVRIRKPRAAETKPPALPPFQDYAILARLFAAKTPEPALDECCKPLEVVPAKILRRSEVPYPGIARKRGIVGTVVLEVTVGANGGVTNIRTISGNELLAGAALRAARNWQYAPGLLNGVPVESGLEVEIVFPNNHHLLNQWPHP